MVESPETAPYLCVRLQHRIGTLQLDVDFELTKPWTVLFGPSGSGKTTILRAIAGLLRPDAAKIVSGTARNPQSLSFVDTQAGTWMPAHQRGIPLAPQRPSLFPHLTVLENLAYRDRATANPQWPALPALFEIDSLLTRRPRELSGGEAQRVNLARAIACGGRLLLLDEPFTGLDLRLKEKLIAGLLAWQNENGMRILSVTHDVAEAFQLNAHVIKLCNGRVVQQGPVAAVLADERSRLLNQLSPPQ